jgi:hypothetical protein
MSNTWNIGVLEYWSIGVLEYWSTGVLEYWSIGSDTVRVMIGIRINNNQ